ncbi:MAG: ribosome silencing factor [Tannerella sp.]|jgi:ribosome-associated protein|nr:ribosome silencing factor [Tannerella sp.]
MNRTKLLIDAIVKGLQEKKGHNIVLVDLREISGAICQYMIICEGNNPIQVSALTDFTRDAVNSELKEKPVFVDGLRNAQWVVLDYGTVIVHIFLPKIRSFYRLENLWEDSKMTLIPDIY